MFTYNKWHFNRLKSQIPDIKSSLQIVKEMKTRKDTSEVIETRFLLSDQVYMQANIPPTDRVCLWLGVSFPGLFVNSFLRVEGRIKGDGIRKINRLDSLRKGWLVYDQLGEDGLVEQGKLEIFLLWLILWVDSYERLVVVGIQTRVMQFSECRACMLPLNQFNFYFCWQANVMLEYGLEDAEGLLSKNLGNATKNLTQVEHDLDFLR